MFSQASEYALRALTELARCEEGQWVLAGDMAELLDVPVHYLAKVLQTLARKGILESQRGRQGGFRLAEAAHQITVYDVVRELDDLRSLESCVMGEAECSDATACPLHKLWKSIRDRFTDSLQTTTLLDLARFQEQRPGSGRLSAVKAKLPDLQESSRRKLDKQV
jgi:Rrf2 family transcriptional regulator, iron-sulfur cluster assembly transcription factor